MSGAFVIRNQLGHYWGKSGSWVKGDRAVRSPAGRTKMKP